MRKRMILCRRFHSVVGVDWMMWMTGCRENKRLDGEFRHCNQVRMLRWNMDDMTRCHSDLLSIDVNETVA